MPDRHVILRTRSAVTFVPEEDATFVEGDAAEAFALVDILANLEPRHTHTVYVLGPKVERPSPEDPHG